jgi:phenylalanine-4-hydroxylase
MPNKNNYLAKTPNSKGFIDYSDQEHAMWAALYQRQWPNTQKYAAHAYNSGLKKLVMPEHRIPQCQEITEFLEPITGWSVQPVPALIGFEQFFTMLAGKRFPAASFIRGKRDFDYIKEPDIFHEIFGHTPLLADLRFAHFSELIGKVGKSLGPKGYQWVIRLYWFTIEFGLSLEGGLYKALGSGLTSSPTELLYGLKSTVPERRRFNVIDILRTPYRIDIHQPIYYVIEHLNDLFDVNEKALLADIKEAQKRGLFEPTYAQIDV